MKLILDIPKEFEKHFNEDRFKDSLECIKADIYDCINTAQNVLIISGNYELELIDMLIVAFEEARIIESSRSNCNQYPSFFAGDKEIRLIDANALCESFGRNEGCQISCMKCESFNCTIGSTVKEAPTIKAEPVKHGRWVIREKDKLVATGKMAVSEGHILHKTSLDEPFTLLSANLIQIKEHRIVNIPYCSICGNYGDDEYDKTPYCPYCGADMGGGVKSESN